MILFLMHTLFICLIGSAVFWAVDTHERNAWMSSLLEFLVVTTGAVAIVHRLLLLAGVGF
jgi:hypothetical protein